MLPADLKEQNRLAIERLIRQLAAAAGRAATALGEAARWGRLDLVQELLAGGLAADARTEAGVTALMLAASGGQPAVVKLLLGNGADVNAVGANGTTPLISCLAARHPKRVYLAVCELLLESGASTSVGVRDVSGRTALDWAKDRRLPEVVAVIDGYSQAEPHAAPDPAGR